VAVKNEVRKKYGLLPPERIAEIRRNAGLTQAELEELLGTGEKVVVRWESGKVIQTSGYDNVLRLIERDPSAIEQLRQIQRLRSGEREKYHERSKHGKGLVAQAV
jgi:DNA-binding transcriptional regulator YiaG